MAAATPARAAAGGESRAKRAGDNRLPLGRVRRRAQLQRLDDEQWAALTVAIEALQLGRVKRHPSGAFGQQRRILAAAG